tara:strand:+ start:54218 stop:54421 length:204 start_codon:yes stop_codon:yes gene_type:complete
VIVMARYQTRPREDGCGPYRWAHVVKTPEGFAQGSIYRQVGDDLDDSEAQALRSLCELHGFEIRRVS